MPDRHIGLLSPVHQVLCPFTDEIFERGAYHQCAADVTPLSSTSLCLVALPPCTTPLSPRSMVLYNVLLSLNLDL